MTAERRDEGRGNGDGTPALKGPVPVPPPPVPPGRYRHFKGGEYEVLAVATHSETHERVVVYRPLYNDSGWWVRPLDMFLESVNHEGRTVPRFTRTG